MNYKEKLHIDIFDLAKSLLKHWKALAIGALLGVVVFSGYLKSRVTFDSDIEKVANEYERGFFRASLSDEDAVLVEGLACQYLHFANEYSRVLDYGDDSLVLKIDPHNTPRMMAAYSLKGQILGGEQLVMSDARDISSAYELALKDDSVIEEIRSRAKVSLNNSAINELIAVELNGISILNISVVGIDKTMCEAIMPILEEKVEEVTSDIKRNYSFDISKMNTYYTLGNDLRLDSVQKEYNSYVYNLRRSMDSLALALTPEQKIYYTALIENVNAEVLSKNDGQMYSIADLIPKNSSTQAKHRPNGVFGIKPKNIVIGFVGGAFLVVAVLAALYLVSGKLHTAEDLRYAFGLSVIGEVAEDSGNKIDVITSEIGIAASKIKASKLCIIGASVDEVASHIRGLITKGVQTKSGIESCEACNDVINSIADMETMSGSEAVVLVEKKNSSRYEDIAKELELCNKYEVKVLGAVILN